MSIKTTIACAVASVAACVAVSPAGAAPLALNKSVTVSGTQIQNVDYRCYRRHGLRYCRDTYTNYDDSYDYDYYGPGVVIGVGRHHHNHHGGGHGGTHFYRSSPGGGFSGGHVGHGPSGGGGPGGAVGHAAGGGIGGGGGMGGGGMGGGGHGGGHR